MTALFIRLFLLYLNVQRKTGVQNICLKFLCDVKSAPQNWWHHFSFFNISSKDLKWNQHFYTDTFWNYLLLNMSVWWGCISRMRRGGAGRGSLMSNLCLISHLWYDVEKLTVSGSRIKLKVSRGTTKRFVLKRWKKNVLHLVLLNLIQLSGEG